MVSLLLGGITFRWEVNMYLPNKLKMVTLKPTGNRFAPKGSSFVYTNKITDIR